VSFISGNQCSINLSGANVSSVCFVIARLLISRACLILFLVFSIVKFINEVYGLHTCVGRCGLEGRSCTYRT